MRQSLYTQLRGRAESSRLHKSEPVAPFEVLKFPEPKALVSWVDTPGTWLYQSEVVDEAARPRQSLLVRPLVAMRQLCRPP